MPGRGGRAREGRPGGGGGGTALPHGKPRKISKAGKGGEKARAHGNAKKQQQTRKTTRHQKEASRTPCPRTNQPAKHTSRGGNRGCTVGRPGSGRRSGSAVAAAGPRPRAWEAALAAARGSTGSGSLGGASRSTRLRWVSQRRAGRPGSGGSRRGEQVDLDPGVSEGRAGRPGSGWPASWRRGGLFRAPRGCLLRAWGSASRSTGLREARRSGGPSPGSAFHAVSRSTRLRRDLAALRGGDR